MITSPSPCFGQIMAAVHGAATEAVLFYLFAALVTGASLAVVICRDVVRMSIALLFALAGVAGLFFLLNAEFLAAVQLVVYVGGTLILIVFGVMLTSKSPFSRFDPSKKAVVFALTLAALLVATLVLARPADEAAVPLTAQAAPTFFKTGQPTEHVRYDAANATLCTDRRLSLESRQALLDRADTEGEGFDSSRHHALATAMDDLAHAARALPVKASVDSDAGYPVAALGAALLGEYLLPFELASVILLAVMIGAAFLAKGRRHGAVA